MSAPACELAWASVRLQYVYGPYPELLYPRIRKLVYSMPDEAWHRALYCTLGEDDVADEYEPSAIPAYLTAAPPS